MTAAHAATLARVAAPMDGRRGGVMFADLTVVASSRHWHVMDHYSGESRVYPHDKYRAMRAWVRYHGYEPIVEVVQCDEPRCLEDLPL